jgi:hypothetical protein
MRGDTMPIQIIYDDLADFKDKLPLEQSCSFKIDLDTLVCPLTNKRLVDPVVASDGYTYSKAAIEKWFSTQTDKNFAYSPISGCENILEIDNKQQLVLRPNLLIKDLLELDENASISINDSRLLDHITLALIRMPIICSDNRTYDLSSEATWIKDKSQAITSLSREPHAFTTFENRLVAKILKNFHNEYGGLHRVTNLKARTFFHLIKTGKIEDAKEFIRANPELCNESINEDNAQLIHIVAALDEVAMFDFLVKTMKANVYSSDKNNNTVLNYACKSPTLKVLNYWHHNIKLPGAKSSLNYNNDNSHTDILIQAIALNRHDILREAFNLGFEINIVSAKYIDTLKKLLLFKDFEMISLVFSQLKKQGTFKQIAPILLFMPGLANNKLISSQHFKELFKEFDAFAPQLIYAKHNPYILGAMGKNIAYLQAFHSYWQEKKYPAIINKLDVSEAENGVNCLQMATFSKLSRLIMLLLSYGALPTYKNLHYPLDKGIITLIDQEEVNNDPELYNEIACKTIVAHMGSPYCQLNVAEMCKILGKFNSEILKDLFTNNNYQEIININKNNNEKLRAVYQDLARKDPNIKAIFTVDFTTKQSNIFHVSAKDPKLGKFSQHLAVMYPSLLAQKDPFNNTPLDYAMRENSLETIKAMLNTIYNLRYTDKFKDFNHRNVLNSPILAFNPNLSDKERSDLKSWVKEKFEENAVKNKPGS